MRDPAPLATALALAVLGTAPAIASEDEPGRKPRPIEIDLYAARTELSGATAGDVTLRVAAGRRWRVRARVPYLRLEDPEGALTTPFGSAPLSAEQRQRRSGRSASTRALPGEAAATVSGLGDVRLGVLGALAGGGARLYRLDAEFDVKAPTGDEEAGLGTGEWDARIGLLAERAFWSWTAFGGAGWTRTGDPDWIDLRDAPDAYLGAETEPRAGGVLWSVWAHAAGEVVPGAGAPAELAVGARGSSRISWRLSVARGLGEPAPDWRVSVGVGWRPGRARPRTPPELGR